MFVTPSAAPSSPTRARQAMAPRECLTGKFGNRDECFCPDAQAEPAGCLALHFPRTSLSVVRGRLRRWLVRQAKAAYRLEILLFLPRLSVKMPFDALGTCWSLYLCLSELLLFCKEGRQAPARGATRPYPAACPPDLRRLVALPT